MKKRYGKLKVVRTVATPRHWLKRLVCQCDCGRTVTVLEKRLALAIGPRECTSCARNTQYREQQSKDPAFMARKRAKNIESYRRNQERVEKARKKRVATMTAEEYAAHRAKQNEYVRRSRQARLERMTEAELLAYRKECQRRKAAWTAKHRSGRPVGRPRQIK